MRKRAKKPKPKYLQGGCAGDVDGGHARHALRYWFTTERMTLAAAADALCLSEWALTNALIGRPIARLTAERIRERTGVDMSAMVSTQIHPAKWRPIFESALAKGATPETLAAAHKLRLYDVRRALAKWGM